MRINKNEAQRLRRKIDRVIAEVILTILCLVFHGMWSSILLFALLFLLLIGVAENTPD